MVRAAGILYESLVNGPGLRRVIFAQGCKHNCEGCFNPHTHSFEQGQLMDMDEILKSIKDNPIISGVTFSGGDPFEQGDKFAYMAKKIKEFGINIWCYTGYTFEQIIENKNCNPGWEDLIKYLDVLVDGKFQQDKMCLDIKYRGSSNQRIIDIQKSLKEQKVITIEYDS